MTAPLPAPDDLAPVGDRGHKPAPDGATLSARHGAPSGDQDAPSRPSLFDWDRLNNPERFEAYNRWTFVFLLLSVPLFGIALLAGAAAWTPAAAVVYAAVVLLHGTALIGAFYQGVDYALGRRDLPWHWLAALGLTTAALVVVVLMGFPGVLTGGLTSMDAHRQAIFTLAVALVPPTFVLATLVRSTPLSLASLGSGVIGGVVMWLGSNAGWAVSAAVVIGTVAVAMGLSTRMSIWTMIVVWDVFRRREVDARLAVAEERLRISRDLHDVFGRTLSTVAVKSELGAALARRGDDRGAQEMLAVRELAQEALKEVRAVVQGYRAADLSTELVGAREILTASGIAVTMTGEHLQPPEPVQQALAWVVREGVTNVVRHSRAQVCEIALSHVRGGFGLQITNDGADSGESSVVGGHGLRGLAERLGALGGTVETPHAGHDRFTLSAWVPAGTTAAGGSEPQTSGDARPDDTMNTTP